MSEDRDTKFWLGWENREKQTHWRRVDKRLILRTRGPGGRRALQESGGGLGRVHGRHRPSRAEGGRAKPVGTEGLGGPAGEQARCPLEPERVLSGKDTRLQVIGPNTLQIWS